MGFEIFLTINCFNKVNLMETAILGGGCFWCIEALLKNLRGVQEVTPGYCGGDSKNPNYSDVKSGVTGHIEVVQIKFDPVKISF